MIELIGACLFGKDIDRFKLGRWVQEASIDLFAWNPGMWEFPTVTETKSIKSIVLVVSRCGWSPFIAGFPVWLKLVLFKDHMYLLH